VTAIASVATADFHRRRRVRTTPAARPAPTRSSVAGSGTGAGEKVVLEVVVLAFQRDWKVDRGESSVRRQDVESRPGESGAGELCRQQRLVVWSRKMNGKSGKKPVNVNGTVTVALASVTYTEGVSNVPPLWVRGLLDGRRAIGGGAA
jgi:hypothetical protein